jgi:hypothetical protein
LSAAAAQRLPQQQQQQQPPPALLASRVATATVDKKHPTSLDQDASAIMYIHRAFAASAIAVTCCVCLVTALKRVFRSECIEGQDAGRSGSALRPTITSLLVAAALALAATAACVAKPLSQRAATVVVTMCSKWQPVYFMVVSVQKVALRALVASYARGSTVQREAGCGMSADVEGQCLAAALVWDSAVLLAGVCVIYTDIDSNFTPAMRRLAQCGLALCLCVDAVGSYVWGNDVAGTVSVSVSRFEFVLDNQMTSCVTSQAVLGVYFAYVGWRSRRGRGWYYASLRFELDVCGQASLSRRSVARDAQDVKESMVSSSSQPPALFEHLASAATTEAAVGRDGLQSEADGGLFSTALSRARQRLLQFQSQQLSKCRVFVIPCVAVSGAGGVADFALARPAFDVRLLRPLQRVADAHPKFYVNFMFFFLAVPVFISSVAMKPQVREIPNLFLFIVMDICWLGFLSSRHYNVDKVAVKHVVLSFRFLLFVVLLLQGIALEARRAHLVLNQGAASIYDTTPLVVSTIALVSVAFCLCLLFDCSPQLPAAIQFVTTVRARYVAKHQITCSHYLQVGFWLAFGFRGLQEMFRVYTGEDADCFWDIGAYHVCDATQRLSIFSSLFLLMTQALVSRILVPGKSNFVNASVRRSPRRRVASAAAAACDTCFRFCAASAL